MSKIQITYTDPKALRPNPWNTNRVSPENEKKIEASMDRLDWFKPIIVRELEDGSLEILAGEHRSSIAARKGGMEVPIVNLGRVDDVRAKEISLVDNGRYGSDDALALAELLKSLPDSDFAAILPMSDEEITSIFAANEIDLDALAGFDDDEDEDAEAPLIPEEKPIQTHQMLRFKVPIDDAHKVIELVERTIKEQGYTNDDSLTNAGDALIHLLKDK